MVSEDILINIMTNYDEGLKKVVSDGEKVVATYEKVSQVGNKLAKTATTMEGSLGKDGSVRIGLQKTATTVKELPPVIDKATSAFSKLRGGLLGVGFALLFGGMALKRFFDRIIKGGVSTFKQLMDTTNNQGYAIKQLGVWWDFLKFKIGSAINQGLERVMPYLIKLINWVIDFVGTHPEEVFAGLATAVGLFAAAMVEGQTILAVASLGILVEKVTALSGVDMASISLGLSGIATALGALATLGIVAVGYSFNKEEVSAKFTELTNDLAANKPLEAIFDVEGLMFSLTSGLLQGFYKINMGILRAFAYAQGKVARLILDGMALIKDAIKAVFDPNKDVADVIEEYKKALSIQFPDMENPLSVVSQGFNEGFSNIDVTPITQTTDALALMQTQAGGLYDIMAGNKEGSLDVAIQTLTTTTIPPLKEEMSALKTSMSNQETAIRQCTDAMREYNK